jgi:hypothetical protein
LFLPGSCSSGRDYPDNFLTFLISKPSVNDKKNCSGTDLTKRDVPVFVLAVANVLHSQGIWIIEDQRGSVEINAMVSEILLVLFLVELKLHIFSPQPR